MVPDPEAVSILLEVEAEPIGDSKELLFAFDVPCTAPKVVVAQSVLRDGDGVILHSDVAVIVELRNTFCIVGTLVVSFFRERHVIFAELGGACVRIFSGSFVPEGEMTLASDQVSTEDAAVVGEGGQCSVLKFQAFKVSEFHKSIHGTTACEGIGQAGG